MLAKTLFPFKIHFKKCGEINTEEHRRFLVGK